MAAEGSSSSHNAGLDWGKGRTLPRRIYPKDRPVQSSSRNALSNNADWILERQLRRESSNFTVWPSSPPRRPSPPPVSKSPLQKDGKMKQAHRRRLRERRTTSSDKNRSVVFLGRNGVPELQASSLHHNGYSNPPDSHEDHNMSQLRRDSGSRQPGPSHRETESSEEPRDSTQGKPANIESSLSSKPSHDTELGPVPPSSTHKLQDRAYGHSLLRGEGTAMAAYVQEGKRIPRRGEIGLNSDQIEAFEQAGFVMSGSRHHAMNAVRERKENLVINAEQKRTLLKIAEEEKRKREAILAAEFRDMVAQRLSKVSEPELG